MNCNRVMKQLKSVFLAILALLALSQTAIQSAEPKPIKLGGLHNVFSLDQRIFSGSAPETDEDFAALKKLGVKTIISVDGSKPLVEKAHEYGMKYVHLPHGYDGIPRATQISLVKASQVSEGPIYVHCHHGKHRGPAAAAVICMADSAWTSAQGEEWLHSAGTATNYQGLFKTVREFTVPTAAELQAAPKKFPESQSISLLVDAMVAIDLRLDELKKPGSTGQGILLWEQLREAQRLPEAQARGQGFLAALKNCEDQVHPLAETPTATPAQLEAIGKTCAQCHKRFRD